MALKLKEILPEEHKINWERTNHTKGYHYGLPVVGGGFPTTKTDTYDGNLGYNEVRLSRTRLTLSVDTLLNLSPDYRGTWEWYRLEVNGENISYGDERLEPLFRNACSSYRKLALRKTIDGAREFLSRFWN